MERLPMAVLTSDPALDMASFAEFVENAAPSSANVAAAGMDGLVGSVANVETMAETAHAANMDKYTEPDTYTPPSFSISYFIICTT